MEIKDSYFKNIRNEMLSFVPKECTRVLDVGCAEGNFGKALKERNNAEVWGVEISEAAGNSAKKNIDKVLIGDFNTIIKELPDNYFDCIIFNDVMEHFIDPFTVLELIKTKLSENAIIVSSIPNVRYVGNLFELLFKKDWEYKSDGILDITHYRFFTQKSINRMFKNAGFEIIKSQGINPSKGLLTKLAVIFTFGYYSDIKYLEFATIARLKK